MLVYVLDMNGRPLMPSSRCGKVRRLLNSNKAKVVKRCPFTIQLLYEPETHITQDITLGVDAGSKHIGLSATTKDKVLYEGEVELRSDIVGLLSTRKELRKSRRNRKTRYRAPRFSNRVASKKEGWLAPSISHRVNTHLVVVEKLHKILPISKIIIEVASFDTQLLKAKELSLPLPQGIDYQQGEQLYSWNVREYVLFRDGYKCRCCRGKSKDKILNVHHIESRKTGGDSPNNLVTLCKYCHDQYHLGKIQLPNDITRGNSYRDAAFMSIMRWVFYNKLKELYPNVSLTYGYITKNTRINAKLPKAHYIDARCISGNPLAVSLNYYYHQKKVRCHNRQIHKCKTGKDGCRKLNQAPYIVKGFRLHDKVRCNKQEWYIHGRRLKGSFVLKTLQGDTLEIVPSKIQLINYQKSFLVERRLA